MKRQELIELLSSTQDSNVLVKGFGEDDFLSKVIMKAIDENTDEDGNVDVSEVRDVLNYSYDQLLNAGMKAEEILKQTESEVEAQEFDIEVCRIGYGFATVTVTAKTLEEAEELALDEAGSHVFTEKDAEYKIAE